MKMIEEQKVRITELENILGRHVSTCSDKSNYLERKTENHATSIRDLKHITCDLTTDVKKLQAPSLAAITGIKAEQKHLRQQISALEEDLSRVDKNCSNFQKSHDKIQTRISQMKETRKPTCTHEVEIKNQAANIEDLQIMVDTLLVSKACTDSSKTSEDPEKRTHGTQTITSIDFSILQSTKSTQTDDRTENSSITANRTPCGHFMAQVDGSHQRYQGFMNDSTPSARAFNPLMYGPETPPDLQKHTRRAGNQSSYNGLQTSKSETHTENTQRPSDKPYSQRSKTTLSNVNIGNKIEVRVSSNKQPMSHHQKRDIRKYYIGNIPEETTEDDIWQYMESFGVCPTFLSVKPNLRKEGYLGAKLHVHAEDRQHIENSDFWPRGVYARIWRPNPGS